MIHTYIENIKPSDPLERQHRLDILNWVQSGAQLYRIEKPDVPNQHLVSYFVLIDQSVGRLLLVDHKKAGKWLPPGGHVEPGEDPVETVKRECLEELNIEAQFISTQPLFVTVTQTVNTPKPHTDVSLWFILAGNSKVDLQYDSREFNGYEWLTSREILDKDISTLDPHLHRFIRKLMNEHII